MVLYINWEMKGHFFWIRFTLRREFWSFCCSPSKIPRNGSHQVGHFFFLPETLLLVLENLTHNFYTSWTSLEGQNCSHGRTLPCNRGGGSSCTPRSGIAPGHMMETNMDRNNIGRLDIEILRQFQGQTPSFCRTQTQKFGSSTSLRNIPHWSKHLYNW